MEQMIEEELGFGYRIQTSNRTSILEHYTDGVWKPILDVVEVRHLVGARQHEQGYLITLIHGNGTNSTLRVEDKSEVMVVLKGWVRQYWENKA